MFFENTGGVDLQELLGGLPPWAQVLVGGTLVALVLVAARTNRNRHRSETRRPSAPSATAPPVRKKSVRNGAARPRERTARRGEEFDSSTQQMGSPGQFGPHRTRDLDARTARKLIPSYSPALDGDPDPGEVVWTWVPYVENDGRGKDRPVLIIARIDATSFAACYLSTKEHDGFVSIGSGGWDPEGRESFLSPERVLQVDETGMRREGQALALPRFARAVNVVAREHGFATLTSE